MSEHVLEWIAAYHDGELVSSRRRQVEVHLQDCADCRAELEALQGLSALLQEAPAPRQSLSDEKFASQVRLRMGPQPEQPLWRRGLSAGWWSIPAGVIGMWAFGQAALLVGGWLLALLPILQPSIRMNSLLQGAAWLPLGSGVLVIVLFYLLLSLTLTTLTAILLAGWLASGWARFLKGRSN